MNAIRLIILVLVTYALGLGTGVVGGVFLSYQQLARVAAAPAPVAIPSPSPADVALNPPVSASPVATAAQQPSPRGSTSPAPSASPSAVAMISPAASSTHKPPPSPSASPASGSPAPETEPSESAVPEESTSPGTSSSPESPSPSPKSAKPDLAVVDILANKGEGYATFVDGKSAGETPVTVQLQPNLTHKIKVVGGDKFVTWEGTVKLEPGQKRVVTAELKTKAAPAATPHHEGGGYVPVPQHQSGGAPSLDNQTRRF